MTSSSEVISNLKDSSELVWMAKLAEQAERFEDMVLCMNKVVRNEKKLSTEERNLLSVAYKNLVGTRRAAWRVVSQVYEMNKSSAPGETILESAHLIENDLEGQCRDVIQLLEDILIDEAKDVEAQVFYLKMAGDYYRYLGEIFGRNTKNTKGEEAIKNAKKNYERAMTVAGDEKDGLKKTNPILLGLTLNYSVFYFEILGDGAKACSLAKDGFDQAVEELDTLEEESYKDATLIMQLLRDNLTLWAEESQDNPDLE